MDTLSPKLVRRMFIATAIMMIISVMVSLFSAATVLSAPNNAAGDVPKTVGFEGFLADDQGNPLGGTQGAPHKLTFRIYDDPTASSSSNLKFEEIFYDVTVTNGLYAVQLGSTSATAANDLVAAVSGTPRYIAVKVDDGTELSPRITISSVPFALNASTLRGGAGMIALFEGTECPVGWQEYTNARGRYVVGAPVGGTTGPASIVGTALTNQENRPVGQHTHTITDPGHSHGIWGQYGTSGGANGNPGSGGDATPWTGPSEVKTTGITVNDAGSVSGTNAPYIQLRYCQLKP